MGKRVLIIGLVLLLLLCMTATVFAAPASDYGSEPKPAPAVYYIRWAMLLLVFWQSASYTLKVATQGQPHHEDLTLGYLFAFLIVAIFLISYHPDMGSYTEPVKVGFVRFIILMLSGIFVTVYGILGRHDVEHHDDHGHGHGHDDHGHGHDDHGHGHDDHGHAPAHH